MAYPLQAQSPRRESARLFGAELRRAMRVRKLGRRTLAKQSRTSSSSIYNYGKGNNLPTLATARLLSESLQWDTLVRIIEDARTSTCQACPTRMLNEGGKPRLYCSDACKKVATALRSGEPRRVLAVRYERRLNTHIKAVDAMCRQCEPEGYCQTPDCPLRGVSPLPLLEVRKQVEFAHPSPRAYGNGRVR